MPRSYEVALFAGEASGDRLGADLVRTFRAMYPHTEVSFWGCGGPALAEASMTVLVDNAALSVMGFSQVMLHGWTLYRTWKRFTSALRDRRPDVFVAIDYSGMNLRLARFAKQQGIPVLYYVSPQVWAWRSKRMVELARVVNHLLVLYAFEKDFYQKHMPTLPVTYVGHPAAQQSRHRSSFGGTKQPLMMLLPGSRRQEVAACWKTLCDCVAAWPEEAGPVRWVCVVAEQWGSPESLKAQSPKHLPIQYVAQDALSSVLAQATGCVCVSGTVTLEVLLARVPMVVVYRTSTWMAMLLRYCLKTPWVALPNILAQQAVVPECLQERMTPAVILPHLQAWMDPERRKAYVHALEPAYQALSQPASKSPAEVLGSLLDDV